MKKPLVSIILPVFNTGAYLNECIESILSQSFTDFELILVDDGSTDNSLEIEASAVNKDSRVKLIQSNSGCVSIARNMGIDESKGEWIYFVDSDDYILPDSLKIMVAQIHNTPDADFIQGAFSVIYRGAITHRSKRFDTLDKYAGKVFTGLDYLEKMSLSITYPWNSLVRKSFLENNGIKFKANLNVQEDLIYIIDILRHGAKGVLVSVPTYMYRYQRTGSLSTANELKTAAQIKKRKRFLTAMIFSAEYLTDILSKIDSESQVYSMLNDRRCKNLTGIIGGSIPLYPDKEIFEMLTDKFPKIPLAGSFAVRLFGLLYNFNHNLAYKIRKLTYKGK